MTASANRATRQNIFDAIEETCPAGPERPSGSGLSGQARNRERPWSEAKSYYLPVDVEAQSGPTVERTGIDMEELARKLSTLRASQFTVFIDACREDPFPGRGLKGNTMTDVMARVLRIVPTKSQQVAADPPTSVIFYACKIGERAFENVKLGHGVFTYYILRGLRELAGRPDGRVEAGQLAGYLRENVGTWVRENGSLGAEQTPTMTAIEVRGPVLIARISPITGSARRSRHRAA
ncbi:MAG: caspase family protein [Acidobacteria bacterium]|nr:caspase family protein [Acidobacteriota bacterium]